MINRDPEQYRKKTAQINTQGIGIFKRSSGTYDPDIHYGGITPDKILAAEGLPDTVYGDKG